MAVSTRSITHRVGETTKSFGFGELQRNFQPKFDYYSKQRELCGNFKWSGACYKAGEKQILNNITGHVNPGEVLAIMGLRGSGKTSLLILPNKKNVIEGDFYLNKENVSLEEVRAVSAYVTDLNTLYLTETPRECLEFSMKLRYPKTYVEDSIYVNFLINDILKGFDLVEVKDKPLRTLDVSYRKRTSIAVELISFPQILFLEESLEGLNSFEAWKLLVILRNLASATGCSVILTIQHPTSEIFHEVENVMMLLRGEILYNGKVEPLANVMDRLGHPVPQLTNPADYILLLAEELPKDELFKFNEDTLESIPKIDTADIELAIIPAKSFKGSIKPEPPKIASPISFFNEIKELLWRDMKWVVRSNSFLLRHIVVRAVAQIVFGLLFWRALERDGDFQLPAGLVALTFTTMFLFIPSMVLALKNYPDDRTRFLTEYRKDTYSSISYGIAQLCNDLFCHFVAGFVTFVLFYAFIGASANIGLLILVGWLISFSSNCLGMFIAAAVSNGSYAIRFALIILVPKIFLSGMLVPMPSYLNWFQYLSLIKYGLTVLAHLEFTDCGTANELADFSALEINCTDADLQESGEYHGNCEDLLEDIDFTTICVANFGQRDLQLERWASYILIILFTSIFFRLASLLILVYRARKFTK